MKFISVIFTALLIMLSAGPVLSAESLDEAVSMLQTQWAINNYKKTGKEQVESFQKLIESADSLVERNPNQASLYIWRGIINSTFAGVKGGLGAMKYAKASKADLEKAMELDPDALQGSAYTSLGTLMFKVPGWPIGFGDDKKAEELLQHALEINPDGIDPNYFYGDYLRSKKRYTEARAYMQHALEAEPRQGRELADSGRRNEIREAMEDINKHLR
ncbi:MAG: tetratricopeptide repeat protein [Porticoccaceae bacterium]